MGRYEISEVNLDSSRYIWFEFFEVWVFNFSLKEETIRNIHNQNVAELAHGIIVFYTQEVGTCFVDAGILVWHLFSLGRLKSSLSYLI